MEPLICELGIVAAGVPVSYNGAQFLGHLPGRRGARGTVPIGPGTLLVIDEASMLSAPDLAELIAYAQARGAKIVLAGDAAAAAYVALSADGTDVLLMAADHALRRELSRRIRDDLIQLGIVAAGPAVRIADGAQPAPAT